MVKRLHFVLSLLVAVSMVVVPIVTAQDATPIVGGTNEEIIVDQDAGDTSGDESTESASTDTGDGDEQSVEADDAAANEDTGDAGDSDEQSGESDDPAASEETEDSTDADADNEQGEVDAPPAPAELRIAPMSLDDDPPTITIKLVDAEGNPIPGPEVEIGWMDPGFTSYIGNVAQADGTVTQPVDPSVTHYRIRAYGPWLEQFGELNGDDPQVVVLERTTDTQIVTFTLAHGDGSEEPFTSGSVLPIWCPSDEIPCG
ncbi:MAG: hypothetical protein M9950_08875 [Thermomicrobiales bacterium]|nr:hypothetical protein [Thermomicrobiales bacterium]